MCWEFFDNVCRIFRISVASWGRSEFCSLYLCCVRGLFMLKAASFIVVGCCMFFSIRITGITPLYLRVTVD